MTSGLLRRILALTVATFALVSVVVFLVEYLGRHGVSPPVLPFGGWQVDLVLAGFAVVALILLAAGGLAVRRMQPVAGTPRTYQIIAALVAVLLGGTAAAASRHQPERAYNWASAKTGSAHRFAEAFARQTLRDFGDATHAPVLRSPGSPASAEQSALLLVPSDLGDSWRYGGSPRVWLGHPDAVGAAYTARTLLTAEHWNGTLWAHDQDVVESVTRYDTAAHALAVGRDLNSEVKRCNLPSPCTPAGSYVPQHDDGLLVWVEGAAQSVNNLNAVIVDNTMTIDIVVSPGLGHALPPLTGLQVLRAAIHRAESAN